MKVAVTGATGFVGRHVVAELERLSISPVLVCRPSLVCRPPGDKPPSFSRHVVAPVDLRHAPAAVFDLMGQPDVLIHLAWGGLPNYSSLVHFEEELPAQYSFLKRMIESGLRNLLVTGTCLEYGMQSGPLCEDLDTRPTTPYGFAKDTLRRQLEYLGQSTPFKLTWARLFYLHGEGQACNSLLPQLKTAVERGDRVFNMSGGEQLRDYLPVTVLARQLVGLAITSHDHGIVNTCSGTPVSVRTMVEQWVRDNGWNIDLNFGFYPYPAYEPMAFWGDRAKLNRCLGSADEVRLQ